jgi:hypothetical protein
MFKDSKLLGSCAVLTDSYRRFEEAQSHLQTNGCCTVKMKVLRFSEISVTDYQLAHGNIPKDLITADITSNIAKVCYNPDVHVTVLHDKFV